MTKTSYFLLCFLLTVASAAVFAENDTPPHIALQGIVYDENNEPLPGASVVIVGTTIGAGTNSDGKFIIQTNEDKEQKLHISYTGYQPEEIKADATNRNSLVVKLKPAENELHEVVVTTTRIEKPLKDVPILTRIISQKNIQALNPMNIETLLQYELPGLQIGYNSMSQQPAVTYQGVSGEYLLFLIDGERVSGEGSDHNVDFSRFNVDDIERIEVIKGSQSTIYGSNALGGVINIITKQANRPFTGYLNARYAGTNGQKYSASAGTKQNRFSSLTSLTYRTKDTYTIDDSEGKTTVTTNPDGSITEETANASSTTVYGYKIWDATQKFGYTFTEKLSSEIKGTFYHNKRDIRNSYKYQDFFIDYAINAKVKYLIGETQQINFSYIFDNYKKDKDFFEAGYTRTDYRNRMHAARVDYSGTFGKHTLNAGIEGNFEYLKHYMMKDSASASVETYALYLQEDWKITDNINIIAGLRSDYHKKYHLHVTPKISAMYRPSKILTLRAGYSQGFRSPSLKELYQEYDMGGLGWFILYGNPDLKPETSNQYSLSAEVTKGRFNISVSGYHNRFKDKIAYATLGDGTSDRRYVNAEKAKTTGIDFIVQTRLNFGLTMTGSYAYVDDYQEIDGKNTSSVRPNSVTFNAMYTRKFGKIGTSIALNGQWSSKLDTYVFGTSGEYTLTSYDARTLCSINTGVQFPRGISLNLGLDNLFNYKDKASDSSLQLPQKGISGIVTLNLNLADLFKL